MARRRRSLGASAKTHGQNAERSLRVVDLATKRLSLQITDGDCKRALGTLTDLAAEWGIYNDSALYSGGRAAYVGGKSANAISNDYFEQKRRFVDHCIIKR